MTQELYLYSTLHCHLCELAHSLVLQVNKSIEVHLVDIADDATLLDQYNLRIPVLQRKDTKAELNWPFSVADILLFLNRPD